MATDSRSSDPADPLLGYSVVSLFPRTFGDSSTGSTPSTHDNTESLHSCLKSMALRSPAKLLEQAKSILDGGSELLNPKFPSQVIFEDKNEPMCKENPPERRPALGRKRARFSLKPDSSQPTLILEPTLDIDKLQDPEEYFLAHEKLENAKKELKRQKGVLTDPNQNTMSTTVRHRRPGILGRSVSYKHHFSSLLSETDGNLISSQPSIEPEIISPNYNSQVEMADPNVASQERELTVSVTKAENKVDELLNELLSNNCSDLDGDGAVTFLQECLQIKPIDMDKLCLPELCDIQRNDFKSSGGNWFKHRDSLLDISNILKGLSSKTPIKHGEVAESSNPLASPTPPKSPFGSISLLKRHILQSNITSDPFSVLEISLSPSRNSSPVEHSDKQSDKVDNEKELSFSARLKSVILEGDDVVVANRDSNEAVHVITGDSTLPSQNVSQNSSPVEHSDKQSDKVNNEKELSFSTKLKSVILAGDDAAVANRDSNEVVQVITGDSTFPSENALTDDSRRLGVAIDIGLCGSHADLECNIGSSNVEGDLSGLDADTDVRINESNELEENAEDMLQEAAAPAHPHNNIEDSTIESQGDQTTPAAGESHGLDGCSKTVDDDPEHGNVEIADPSDVSLNKRSNAKKPLRIVRKRKEISRRQSLAEAGTLWSSGVRRSTRIKMRPLEYWKGERFLYGRIHQSLTTVIGVKYVSPAKGGREPTIKVKSYVSDDYKELVELAALH